MAIFRLHLHQGRGLYFFKLFAISLPLFCLLTSASSTSTTPPSTCSFPDQTAHVQSQVDRSFIDHAVRALRRTGFGVVATVMAIEHSILIRQKEITVFAPSDASLFSGPDGFRFDFLRHVLPIRCRLADVEGTAIGTLSPNKSVVVLRSRNGDVTVNGVGVRSSEIYRNRWIVVFAVSHSIDDDDVDDVSAAGDASDLGDGVGISGRPEEDTSKRRLLSEVSPATWNGGFSSLGLAVEGQEPLCPATLQESRVGSGGYVERSRPSTSYDEFAIKLVRSGPSRGFNRGF